MRLQKIALNLTVVDVESFAELVYKEYYHERVSYGLSLSDRDADKLLLYYIAKNVFKTLQELDNRKNVIFYTNSNTHIEISFKRVFAKLCKVFPILHYTNTLDFSCLQDNKAAGFELSTLIKDYRFSFDFNKFTNRKMKTFLDKHKFNLSFPI
jgi:hypothetical protein